MSPTMLNLLPERREPSWPTLRRWTITFGKEFWALTYDDQMIFPVDFIFWKQPSSVPNHLKKCGQEKLEKNLCWEIESLFCSGGWTRGTWWPPPQSSTSPRSLCLRTSTTSTSPGKPINHYALPVSPIFVILHRVSGILLSGALNWTRVN